MRSVTYYRTFPYNTRTFHQPTSDDGMEWNPPCGSSLRCTREQFFYVCQCHTISLRYPSFTVHHHEYVANPPAIATAATQRMSAAKPPATNIPRILPFSSSTDMLYVVKGMELLRTASSLLCAPLPSAITHQPSICLQSTKVLGLLYYVQEVQV